MPVSLPISETSVLKIASLWQEQGLPYDANICTSASVVPYRKKTKGEVTTAPAPPHSTR